MVAKTWASGTNVDANDSLSTLLHSASKVSNTRRLHARRNELHTSPSTVFMFTNDLASVTCGKLRQRKYLSPSRGLKVYILPIIVSPETSNLYSDGRGAHADDGPAPRVPLFRNLARGFHNLSLRNQVKNRGNSSYRR